MSKSKATNYITIEGRLVRTPNFGIGKAKGTPWCFGTLAVKAYYAKEGKEAPTDFFNIKAFGDEAELLKDMVQGHIVRIEGQMRSEKYTDKEGVEKQGWYVQVAPNGVAPVEARPRNNAPTTSDEDGAYDPWSEE
jgi:hypothetical protein